MDEKDRLGRREVHEVTMDECPDCQGVWLDKGELEELSTHQGGEWVGQFMERLVGHRPTAR